MSFWYCCQISFPREIFSRSSSFFAVLGEMNLGFSIRGRVSFIIDKGAAGGGSSPVKGSSEEFWEKSGKTVRKIRVNRKVRPAV